MSSKQYVVTGACVTHIPVAGPGGPMLVTLYQGASMPEGVPEDRLKHLLDSNLIEEVGGPSRQAEAKATSRGRKPAESSPAAAKSDE